MRTCLDAAIQEFFALPAAVPLLALAVDPHFLEIGLRKTNDATAEPES